MSVGCNIKTTSYGDPNVTYGSLLVPYNGEMNNVSPIGVEDDVNFSPVNLDYDIAQQATIPDQESLLQDIEPVEIEEPFDVDNKFSPVDAILDYDNVEQFKPNIPVDQPSSPDTKCD